MKRARPKPREPGDPGDNSRTGKNIRRIQKYCYIPQGRDVGKRVELRLWQKREIVKIPDCAVLMSPIELTSSITAVYANVRRQKSMCLRKRDALTGPVYWNCTAAELDGCSACSQGRLQATFERVKK
jgi:hypothetical protein